MTVPRLPRPFLLLKLFLSPVGRIRPPLYWAALLALAVVGLPITAAFGMLTLAPANPFSRLSVATAAWTTLVLHTPGPGYGLACDSGGCRFWGTPLSGVITAAFCFSAFCIQSKRLHDAGRSAWWVIGFALFQMLAPFGLGYLTKALFRPEDARGFIFVVLSGGFVAMFLPLAFKAWIGFSKSRPEPDKHGPRPGKWDIGSPGRRHG